MHKQSCFVMNNNAQTVDYNQDISDWLRDTFCCFIRAFAKSVVIISCHRNCSGESNSAKPPAICNLGHIVQRLQVPRAEHWESTGQYGKRVCEIIQGRIVHNVL